MKLQNATSCIEALLEMTADDYYSEGIEIDEESVSTALVDRKACDLQDYASLQLIGNGYYKGVYRCDINYCAKVLLNDEIISWEMDINSLDKEIILFKFISKVHPELLRYLCPIVAYSKYFVITPIASVYTRADREIINDFVLHMIMKAFKKVGIEFNDLDDRYDNFGNYHGHTVILDYDSWNVKDMSDFDYKILRQLVIDITGNERACRL